MIIQALRAIKYAWNHPLCMDRRCDMLLRFVSWHVSGRLAPGDVAVDWVNGSRFLARPWHYGFSANVYCGLLEFADMSFLLHFLRPEDLFIDVGANRGSYTVLAGAAIGASVVAVEPVPETFASLKHNVELNGMVGRVECLNIGLGDQDGVLRFTADASDCVNHVVAEGEQTGKTVEVSVRRLDDVVRGRSPVLMKMDVEGYEWFVLQGALETLDCESLRAIIVEFNNTGLVRYGVGDEKIDCLLEQKGFEPVRYEPFARKLERYDPFAEARRGNVVYVRGFDEAAQRVASAASYELFGWMV